MAYVFISYSSKNHSYARQLVSAMTQQGFDVWFDDQIGYGANWERTIFQVIDGCSAFIVVMTPEAYESDWVQRECHYAEKRHKPTLPLLLAGEEFPRYGLIQYVDVSEGKLPPDEFYERLSVHLPRKNNAGGALLKHESPPANLALTENASELSVPEPTKVSANPKLFLLSPNQTITPLIQHYLDQIIDPATPPVERTHAGKELNAAGDPRRGTGLRMDRIPDIDWVKIPEGSFLYQQDQNRTLPAYYISRYPVTYQQFQAFLDEPAGYTNDLWWQDLAVRQNAPGAQTFKMNNHPRENVSWYDAVAFCRWLSAKLNYRVRLPTDAEWEKAGRGTDGRLYPWGDQYESGYANVNEATPDRSGSFLRQTTAVGIFAQAASVYGVLDLAGNVWEWCANLYDDPDNERLDELDPRTLRGGSWYNPPSSAQTIFRAAGDADGRTQLVGFRIARSAR